MWSGIHVHVLLVLILCCGVIYSPFCCLIIINFCSLLSFIRSHVLLQWLQQGGWRSAFVPLPLPNLCPPWYTCSEYAPPSPPPKFLNNCFCPPTPLAWEYNYIQLHSMGQPLQRTRFPPPICPLLRFSINGWITRSNIWRCGLGGTLINDVCGIQLLVTVVTCNWSLTKRFTTIEICDETSVRPYLHA